MSGHVEDQPAGALLRDEDADTWSAQLSRLTSSWAGLADKPEETPVSSLEELWLVAAGAVAGREGGGAVLPPLDAEGRRRLEELVTERMNGVPLSHITGRKRFMGLDLLTGPEALIPRLETELLATAAIERLKQLIDERGKAVVLDLCTGCGNVAAALASYCPEAVVYGSDISADAVGLANRNAEFLELSDRLNFRTGDLFGAFEGDLADRKVDLVTCNPPYIPRSRVASMPTEIAAFEPREAFDGGSLGLDIIIRLYSQAPDVLLPGSWLCFEVGAGQGDFVIRRMERTERYARIEGLSNEVGEVRAIVALTH